MVPTRREDKNAASGGSWTPTLGMSRTRGLLTRWATLQGGNDRVARDAAAPNGRLLFGVLWRGRMDKGMRRARVWCC